MFGPRNEIMPTLSAGAKIAPLAPTVASISDRVHAEFAGGSSVTPLRGAVGDQGHSA